MYEYACIVNRGLIHKTNDDCALAYHNIVDDGILYGTCNEEEAVFAVADGVGSIEKSYLASRIALHVIESVDPGNYDDVINKIGIANDEIIHKARELKIGHDLASTLCIACLCEGSISTFNLGNSRCYRFHNGYLTQLTKDQKILQKFIDEGVITELQAREHSQANIITHFVGSPKYDPSWVEYTNHREKLNDRDYLLLSSDGLHDYVAIETIEKIMQTKLNTREIASHLLQEVYDKGAQDNITIIVVKRKVSED